MVTHSGTSPKGSASVQEIVEALSEVTGKDYTAILNEMAVSPTHDLAIPSPQAMAVLGKLRARHGFIVTRQDIAKTKRGSCCSINLLADLFNRKTGQNGS